MIGISVHVAIIVLLVSTFGIWNVTSVPPAECLDCGCCVNSTCNAEDAFCTYGCVDGYRGEKCYGKCPEYCKRCARKFPNILYPDDYLICYECAEGYFNGTYKTDCSSPCPRNCLDGVCDKNNGICLLGCTGNFQGRTCWQCIDGWHQLDCSGRCPNNCNLGRCKKQTGYCTNGCKVGYRGNTCNESCPEGCLDNTCGSAKCKLGCKPGYSGDFCCVRSNNCVTCSWVKSECAVCTVGYWGPLCDQQCSEDCLDNLCNISDGSCNACKDGFHGHVCNETCSDNCLDSNCTQSNGSCVNCTDGYFGTFCKNTCSVNCMNTSCSQHDGECLYGCVHGYIGTLCDFDTISRSEEVDKDTGLVKGLMIGISVGIVITVASVVVLWIVCLKRRSCWPSELPTERKEISPVYENTSPNTTTQDDSPTSTNVTYGCNFPQNDVNALVQPTNPQRVSTPYELLDRGKMEKDSIYDKVNKGMDA